MEPGSECARTCKVVMIRLPRTTRNSFVRRSSRIIFITFRSLSAPSNISVNTCVHTAAEAHMKSNLAKNKTSSFVALCSSLSGHGYEQGSNWDCAFEGNTAFSMGCVLRCTILHVLRALMRYFYLCCWMHSVCVNPMRCGEQTNGPFVFAPTFYTCMYVYISLTLTVKDVTPIHFVRLCAP